MIPASSENKKSEVIICFALVRNHPTVIMRVFEALNKKKEYVLPINFKPFNQKNINAIARCVS